MPSFYPQIKLNECPSVPVRTDTAAILLQKKPEALAIAGQ